MKIHLFVTLIIPVVVIFCSSFTADAATPSRPNILFILTDDQNYDTIGCYGGEVLTPTMDRLAGEGTRFTQAFTVHGICTPSRYVCLTGQYASRCETEGFLRLCPTGTPAIVGFNVQTPPGSWTVAKELQTAGYVTGFFGKWHTGAPGRTRLPADSDLGNPEVKRKLQADQDALCAYVRGAGFDVAERVYHGNLDSYQLDGLQVHNQEWIAEGALNFLDAQKNSGKPFYLHLCTTLQHSPPPYLSIAGDPRVTPVGLIDKAPQVQAARETIAPRLKKAGIMPRMGHATWLDDTFAALIDKLEQHGMLDNTAILVFSDNATMKGKGTNYEGGVKVPAFVYWKGHFKPGVVSPALIGNIDYVPTILEIAGIPKPAEQIFDGESFLPIVKGENNVPWRDAIYLEVGHSRAVRTDKWKYLTVRYAPSTQKMIDAGTLGRQPWHADTVFDLQAVAEKNHPFYWDMDQLYDMENDPTEQKNLIADPKYAEVLKELKLKHAEMSKRFPRPYGEFNP